MTKGRFLEYGTINCYYPFAEVISEISCVSSTIQTASLLHFEHSSCVMQVPLYSAIGQTHSKWPLTQFKMRFRCLSPMSHRSTDDSVDKGNKLRPGVSTQFEPGSESHAFGSKHSSIFEHIPIKHSVQAFE